MLEVVLTIPFWLELAASLTGGLSGAMSAVRARYDLFGVACIAIVTGLAGGIIRDILLQQYGIYAFQKPSLILACVIAGVVVFYFKLGNQFGHFSQLPAAKPCGSIAVYHRNLTHVDFGHILGKIPVFYENQVPVPGGVEELDSGQGGNHHEYNQDPDEAEAIF